MIGSVSFFAGFSSTALSVMEAVLPLVILFVVFQLLFLRLPRRQVMNILKGTLIASTGLLLFLQGVNIAFLPFGRIIGEALGGFPHKWILLPFGFVLGFLTTWGEPSVRILAKQVEKASSGSIRESHVVIAICFGVAVVVSLGMFRIGYGIPLLYLLIPGYLIVLATMWFSEKEFLAIAIDAGGVATGPIANTFLLALALGISSSMGDQDPALHGLGFVALIALAPIISVLMLGFMFRVKNDRKD